MKDAVESVSATAPPKRLLMVDDDPAALALLGDVATSSGYAVQSTLSAREFLKAFDFDEPHTVLLDVVMPDDDCFPIMRALAMRGYGRPVIVVTAFGPNMLVPACDYGRALRLNVVDGLLKPIDVFRLRTVLHHTITRH